MIDNLKRINDRQIKLGRLTESDTDKLYLRVFSSEDGELVLQDMANRCYVSETTNGEYIQFYEGMRALYMSIISRLQNAVEIKIGEEING